MFKHYILSEVFFCLIPLIIDKHMLKLLTRTDLSIFPLNWNLFFFLPIFLPSFLFSFLSFPPPTLALFHFLYSETPFLAIYFIKSIISSIASEKFKSLFLIMLLSERSAYSFSSFSAHHFLFTTGWKQKLIAFSLHTGGGGTENAWSSGLSILMGEETFPTRGL